MSHSLDPAVLHSFLEEVRSYLPALEQEAARLRQRPQAPEALSEIHRLAHSIRSACEMIGLDALAGPAREIEREAEPAMYGVHELDDDGLRRLETALEGLRRGLGGEGAPERPEQAGGGFTPVIPAAPEADGAAEAIADEDPVAAELIDTFLSEAEQLLDRMDGCIRALRRQPGAAGPALSELRHHAHTFKGAAGMAGLETASRVAHRTEDLLDLLIAGRLPAESEVLDLLQASHDLLADLTAARGNNRPLKPRIAELLEQLGGLLALCAEQPSRSGAARRPRRATSWPRRKSRTRSCWKRSWPRPSRICPPPRPPSASWPRSRQTPGLPWLLSAGPSIPSKAPQGWWGWAAQARWRGSSNCCWTTFWAAPRRLPSRAWRP